MLEKHRQMLFILKKKVQEFLLLPRQRLFLLAFILQKMVLLSGIIRKSERKIFCQNAKCFHMFVLQEVLVICTYFERDELQKCTVDLKTRGRGTKLWREQKITLFEIWNVIWDTKINLFRHSLLSSFIFKLWWWRTTATFW